MTAPDRAATSSPDISTLLDYEGIRHATAVYCRGIDRLDGDLIREAYHPDAYDDHGPFKGGRDDFVDWIVPFLREHYVSTSHHMTSQHIDLRGDHALVETYAIVAQEKKAIDGRRTQLIANTRYVDRFEKRDGVWRVARRTVVVDSARSDEIGAWEGAHSMSTMTPGTRDRNDPIYRLLEDNA